VLYKGRKVLIILELFLVYSLYSTSILFYIVLLKSIAIISFLCMRITNKTNIYTNEC